MFFKKMTYKYISIKEFMELKILEIDRRTISNYCKKGKIPSIKIDGKYYIKKSYVDKLLGN